MSNIKLKASVKKLFLSCKDALQPLAAIAAIIAVPIYISEAPDRAEARNLMKAQLLLQCIAFQEEINRTWGELSGLGRSARPEEYALNQQREKQRESWRKDYQEFIGELSEMYDAACGEQPVPQIRI